MSAELTQPIDIELPANPLARLLNRVCYFLALFGGLICGVMAVMVTVSVTGRFLFSAPIPGDYDVIGILSGCAAFAFLPYCQLQRGNVMVDFFTDKAPTRVKAALDAMAMVFYLIIAMLFTWRMYYGMLDLRKYNEVIAAFEFYRWWTVPFNIFCMILLVLVIMYTLAQTLRVVAGKDSAVAGGEGAK